MLVPLCLLLYKEWCQFIVSNRRDNRHRCHLRESSGSVSLVGLDSLAASELLVGVGGPDNLLLAVADNREGGEAVALAELATPAGGDGEVAALGGPAVGARGLGGGLGALDDVGAAGGSAGAGVDLEVPGAGLVGGVTLAVEALEGPLGALGHHGDGLASRGGSREDGGGREDGGEESGGELHVGGLLGLLKRAGGRVDGRGC